MFQLRPTLDPPALGAIYREHGRLQIADFLTPDSAAAFYDALEASAEWRLTANRGEQIFDFALDEVGAWDAHKRELLDRAVVAGGQFNFQFRYEVIRVKDDSTGPVAEFRDFMSSADVIEFMQVVTGATDIRFADAHASRYQPGHFLTTHDDRMEAMGRRAAYVMNLTPKWRPDWGGLLQFFDSRGDVLRAFTPGFNRLNLFGVPQPHNVSWVTPLAPAPRYAVTGWLRAE